MANPEDKAEAETMAGVPALLQRSAVVVFQKSDSGGMATISPLIFQWTGFPPKAWLQNEVGLEDFLIQEEDHPCQEATEEVDPSLSNWRVRSFRIRHRWDGTVRRVLEIVWSGLGEGDAGSRGGFGVWLDLSHGDKRNRRLQSGQASEVIRQVAPGIVHDLNNSFLGISSYVDMCLREVTSGDAAGYLRHIRDNTAQAIETVQRFSASLRPQKSNPTFHDLRTILNESLPLLKAALPRRIRLSTVNGPEPLPVMADAGQIREAIFALTFNAMDAIHQAGSIEVETFLSKQVPAAPYAYGCRSDGPVVGLRVRDTGVGFFALEPGQAPALAVSTKKGKAGLGLGLVHALSVAESFGGGLCFEEPEIGGASVILWLPASDMRGDDLPSLALPAPARRFLLVASSCEEVAIWKPHLSKAGIQEVVATRNPLVPLSEAMELYAAVAIPVDLGDGARLIAEIKAQRYEVKIVGLTSGSGEEGDGEGAPSSMDLVLSSACSAEDWRAALEKLWSPA